MTILADIIEILVSGFTSFGQGIGSGVQEMVSALFLTGEAGSETLSTFGVLIVCFAAIALTIGLSRWVMNWVSSLGN